jgi:predicted TIM-barrel fold metal-dependent hydrolase
MFLSDCITHLDADETNANWIDAHAHVWTSDTAKYPLAPGYRTAEMRPPSFTPEELLDHAEPCGVRRVVLIQMSYYQTDNQYMLDAIAARPDRFRGVAIVDEQRQPAEQMKRLATRGVRGFRIQPRDRHPDEWLGGDGMREMWTTGADEGLAMCHLIDAKFLPSVHLMCEKFPQTPVVIDHFGRVGIDGQIRGADLEQLCRLSQHPQVFVKVSAFYALGAKRPPYHDLAPMIQRLLKEFGPERLMWASDCPFQVQGDHSYRASIDLIRAGLGFLSDRDRQWLLRGTAEKVFFA